MASGIRAATFSGEVAGTDGARHVDGKRSHVRGPYVWVILVARRPISRFDLFCRAPVRAAAPEMAPNIPAAMIVLRVPSGWQPPFVLLENRCQSPERVPPPLHISLPLCREAYITIQGGASLAGAVGFLPESDYPQNLHRLMHAFSWS